jgi:3-hydroxymyristoyl/3-hydroxydecanoyl-(acyl carrier protein) dehydratase
MALEKIEIVDRIEVVENGCVQVRTKTVITENGKQISGTFHRHIVVPGADYSKEDARVQAICKVTHTKDVVAVYKAAQAEKQES